MGRPTLSTLAVFAVVFTLQTIGDLIGFGMGVFALSLPLGTHPWTVLTSVYAHGSVSHLLANALAFVFVAPLVARVTTPTRFHVFFVGTGALAGITQVVLMSPFGAGAVLGASGSIFALFGYLLVGNRASNVALGWLPLERRGQLLLFALIAIGLTAVTAAPGIALVAHFTGFCLGAIAGRGRVLHVSRDTVA